MAIVETIEDFALTLFDLQKSDRDVNIFCSGFTGEGKTSFLYQICKAHAKISGIPFSFDNNMTYDRDELLKWIDGIKNAKVLKSGLKQGQIAEFSSILIDELFSIFYKRNWYDDDQKVGVAVFNMCRDRHLLINGAIPNFWDLDGGLLTRCRYYAYVFERGKAWIFEPENNPFAPDPWNRTQNAKLFRKNKGRPYRIPNFVCEIHFEDFTPEEKKEYYEIRNHKRILATQQLKSEKKENYNKIKKQRDVLIRTLCNLNQKLTNKDIAESIGISQEAVRLIRHNN